MRHTSYMNTTINLCPYTHTKTYEMKLEHTFLGKGRIYEYIVLYMLYYKGPSPLYFGTTVNFQTIYGNWYKHKSKYFFKWLRVSSLIPN